MMRLLRVELVKALVRMRTYVAYGIVIAIPIIMTIAIKSNPPDSPSGEGGPGGGALRFLSTMSGWVMPASALRLMSVFLLVIVVAVFGGEAIAGEASWGNLRYLLMRPISRGRLLATKFVVAMICAWLAVTLVVVTGLIAGAIAFGLHPLDVPFFTQYSQSNADLLGHLALATVYVSWTLSSVVAFSFLVSTMTDAPTGAVFAGVGLYITSTILDSIDSIPSGIRNVLPTHYDGAWVDMFTRNSISSDMGKGALLPLAYVAVFVAVAAWHFRRKDILS
ncbi:MAG: ABC transporter permease subunit [Acidimicrobiia bacterium]